MIRSMTGFGKASGNLDSKKVSVEIRSLNSKGLDLNLRVPGEYKELDALIRNLATEKLNRGKVDLSVNIESVGDSASVTINQVLAEKYIAQLKQLNDKIGGSTEDYLSLVLRMPDIYNTEKEVLADEEKNWVLRLVEDALAQVDEFRIKEGGELANDFHTHIDSIRGLLNDVPKYEQERVQAIRERMEKGLAEIENGNFDENRLEQEMIFYIEKLDVSEEKMRLSNHLDYFTETMDLESSGKKLGFIAQEIGREINTLGSKSNNADMQRLVIQMKDNLEKIKEQVLNTL